MLKYIATAVFSILLFAVIIFTAINYHNNEVLESRINTALKYSCDSQSEKSFKEDYYILQQSHDTNLILVVFGLVVAVLGFFTYQNVVAKFDLKASQFDNDFTEFKKEMDEEIGLLKLSNNKDIASLTFELGDDYFKKGDKVNYVYYLLWGLSKYADVILWAINKYGEEDGVKDSTDSMEKLIMLRLNTINRRIGTEILLKEKTLESIEEYIDNIRRLEVRELNKVLSEIETKLKKNTL